MKNGFIIGIHGFAGTGKSQLAEFLSDQNTQTIAFADKMKRDAMDVYGFAPEQLWGESNLRNLPDPRYLEKGISLVPRDVLQQMGSAGRAIYANTWSDYVERIVGLIYENQISCRYNREKGINWFHEPEQERWYIQPAVIDSNMIKHVIISDLRFKNEYDMIKKNNGITIKVKRPGAGLKGSRANHESEAGLPDDLFDFIVDNRGTLDEFKNDALEIKKTFNDVSFVELINQLCYELNICTGKMNVYSKKGFDKRLYSKDTGEQIKPEHIKEKYIELCNKLDFNANIVNFSFIKAMLWPVVYNQTEFKGEFG